VSGLIERKESTAIETAWKRKNEKRNADSATTETQMGYLDLTGVNLRFDDLKSRLASIREARIGTATVANLTVTDSVSLPDSWSSGGNAIRGDYGSPALEKTVTLVSGDDPAATLSWGDYPASAAIGVEMSDPSGTIDVDEDVRHWPREDPNNPVRRVFEFEWVNDPGSDVELDVTVAKII
jgi:hypothetical protein